MAQFPHQTTRPRRAKLTPRQATFIAAYMTSLNCTDAAVAAGYARKHAGAIGQHMLQLPHVDTALREAMDKRAKRTEITQDRVLKELARVGFGDIRAIFDDAGHLKAPHELDDDTAAAIASIEVVERPGMDREGRPVLEYVHKIRLVDKTPALALLCRHLGMLNDKIDLTARLHKVYETAPDEELLARLKTLLLRAGETPLLDGATGEPIAPEAS